MCPNYPLHHIKNTIPSLILVSPTWSLQTNFLQDQWGKKESKIRADYQLISKRIWAQIKSGFYSCLLHSFVISFIYNLFSKSESGIKLY